MVKNKCVSIILPTFNDEKTIARAIKSVILQSYSNWELIVINDNSQDRTLSVIKNFNDKRIRVINNHVNKGVAYSRNIGLDKASGEYIAFLDADDWFDPNYLNKNVSKLVLKNADISVNDIKIVYKNKVKTQSCYTDPFKSYPSVWNKIYKSTLWKNIRFNTKSQIEDFGLVPFLFFKSKRSVKIIDIYYFYYQSSTSFVHSKVDINKQLRVADDVRVFLAKLSEEQLRTYSDSIMKYVNYQLSEHFWKGVEDSESNDELRRLYTTLACYSLKLNSSMFGINNIFYSDNLYHRIRNNFILPFFSSGKYKRGRMFYILLLRVKKLVIKY